MDEVERRCARYVRQRLEQLEAEAVRVDKAIVGPALAGAAPVVGLLVLIGLRSFAGWNVDGEGLLALAFFAFVLLWTAGASYVRRRKIRDEAEVLRNLVDPANL